MTLKLEEIERLDRERTSQYWRVLYPSVGIDACWHVTDFGDTFVAHVRGFNHAVNEQSKRNAKFIAAAPTITTQYLRARKFEVTEEFVEIASKDNDPLNPETGDEWDCLIAYTKEVIRLMWEEVEND